MENELKKIIKYAEQKYNEINKMNPSAFTQGYAMGVIDTIKIDLQTLLTLKTK
jgi:hypothetical protein